MTCTVTKEKTKLTASVEGRVDTVTAPQMEAEIRSNLDGVTELVLDLKDLVYISSAGLRVLLTLQKTMLATGTMVVRNVNEDIMDILEMTGFSDILTIE